MDINPRVLPALVALGIGALAGSVSLLIALAIARFRRPWP